MDERLGELIAGWDGTGVVVRFDAATGTWIFIALHDDTLGAAVGGTRMKRYAHPADGLEDALRLGAGMTDKWAAVGLDSGGGKGVLAVPRTLEGEERQGLLRRYAALINSLKGAFATGRDLGTTDDDIVVMSEVSRHVHGVDRETGRVRDPGPYTSAGVFAAVRAALARMDASSCAGRSILIQGLGDVGRPLAVALAEEGASLLLSDIDGDRAASLAAELGATIVESDRVYDTACDIYAPCAVGATVNSDSIPRLRCRAVVGSANNQLAEEADAARLHARGILYAPDFIANGGGALAFGLIHRGETDEQRLMDRVAGLGDSLAEIFEEAAGRDESPLAAARRRVESALSRGR